MSFPLFLMLAAILLKLGRIADRVDPEPSYPFEWPSWPTWKRIKDSKVFWQILWIPMSVACFFGAGLLLAGAIAGAHLLFVGAQHLLFG